jgi:hypothetical protein
VYVASEHAPEADTDEVPADSGVDTSNYAATGSNKKNNANASVSSSDAVAQALDAANDNAAFLVDAETGPAANSAVGAGGSAGSQSAGTWVQGESVVVQLDRPLLFEGERVTVQLVDRETNSLVMDRTVRIADTERFQFAPGGGATVTDDPAPDSNVTINGSVGAPNGTVGDVTNVTDPGAGGPARDDADDAGSDSNPDVGTGDGDGEPQTKADLDCSFTGQTASGGFACVGDQTSGNDDSATEGYNQVCDDADTDCASGDGGALPTEGSDDDGGYGDGGSDTNSESESDDTGSGGSNYGGSDSGYAKPPL